MINYVKLNCFVWNFISGLTVLCNYIMSLFTLLCKPCQSKLQAVIYLLNKQKL